MMSHKVFELDVRLREIEPPIWRTLEVPGPSSLEYVHFAIQVAMGWTNSHLHQFDIDDTHYGMVNVDEGADLEDERAYSLEDRNTAEGSDGPRGERYRARSYARHVVRAGGRYATATPHRGATRCP
jgi:hypothetical protein